MGGRKMIDIAGQRFGMLTAVRPTDRRLHRTVVWECACDCGNTAYVTLGHLKQGCTKSCGCLRQQGTSKIKAGLLEEILEGMRFGKLTVVRPAEGQEKDVSVWECKCDCGNTTFAKAADLQKGRIESCGCLERELAAKQCLERQKDMIGKRFGRLTAIRPTGEIKSESMVWECKCDCGNTVRFLGTQLRNMKHLSCGCDDAQKPVAKGKSIEGQRFGRLVAIRPTEERKNNSVVWECKCDCGNTVLENQVALTRGRTLSCGCMQKEREQVRLDALTKENAGKRFGRLTILHAVTEDGSRRVQYACRCDCGNEIYAQLPVLKRGLVQSCGCLNKDFGKQKAHDLTGQQFGYLTVIRKTDERRNRAVVWECKCVCGKTTYVAANTLKCGNTKSCGCKGKVQEKNGEQKPWAEGK